MRQEMVTQIANGRKVKEVAKKHGVSLNTVYRVLRNPRPARASKAPAPPAFAKLGAVEQVLRDAATLLEAELTRVRAALEAYAQ
jgi:transposase